MSDPGARDRPRNLDEFLGPRQRTRVIAHRGFSGRFPENTLVAFRRAVELGVDMVELDVTSTRDGELVVLHDETLDRTTSGRGPVRARTLAEVEALDAGTWFDPGFAGERVPGLGETLAELRGRTLVNVEIKEEVVTDRTPGGIAERVIQLVHELEMADQVVLSSFDPRAMRQAREVDPAIRRAALHDPKRHGTKGPVEIMDEIGAVVFSPEKKRVSAGMVAACHAAGRLVTVYTVNREREMRRMIDLGVDGLFTDHPDRLLFVLEA